MVIIPLLLTMALTAYLFLYNQDQAKWKLITTILVVILTYTLVSFFFVRRLGVRIETLRDLITGLSLGEVNHIPEIDGQDEISSLGQVVINIKKDISRKTEFAEHLKAGHFHSQFITHNNEDALAKSLLKIKENLIQIKEEEKKQNWSSEALGKFVEILRSATEIKDLTNNIISSLVNIIDANQGAIYIAKKNDSGEESLDLEACYAFKRTKFLSHRVAIGEGLIGQAYLERETMYLKDVPDDFVKITSGLGESNAKHILIVPLKMNQEIVGLVEIASFNEFSAHEISFVEKIGENIAHTISSIRIAEHTKKLLTESQELTEQMRAQEEELKQNQEELQATQEEISRKYKHLFSELKNLNYESRFDQLRSITMTKKRSIEYYFDIIRNQIITFSENTMVISAMRELKEAFFKLSENHDQEKSFFMKESLRNYYADEFIPRLNENSDDVEDVSKYLPEEIITSLLQFHYISNNPHPTGQKSALDDAGDGSDYSRVHATYHPLMRSFLEKFGYYDIFLVDDVTGYMVYSVFKEVDFATSLLKGVYSKTNFGRVVEEAASNTDKSFVRLIDFEPYDPSYWAPASFIARPIFDGDQKLGILVFQMPINKINQVLTGNNKWNEDGLGESGETFIVGSDYKMRSMSRELIEDNDQYFNKLKSMGYANSIIRQIKKTNTNILLEKVELDSVSKALKGTMSTQLEKDQSGVERLNAFAPLDIADVHWAIMSTMKEKEVSQRINNLQDTNI